MVFVWSPVSGLTKWMLWLTVRCVKPWESRSSYASQQSLTTVVPGSIQACIMAVNVSTVLSGMGTRNVLSDLRSTPPNSHWPLTRCTLRYLRRPNLLSSILTVLLEPPIFSEHPSINTSMVSLQNMPQSVTVCVPKRCSFWIWWAGSRRTMSYVRKRISWKVRLLRWNQEPCLMDLDSEHLAPPTFLRHCQRKPSRILGSADHTISQPQVLHCTLLRSKPTSCKNFMAMVWSQNKNARNILFGPPSSRSIGGPYDDLGRNGIPCTRFSYSATTLQIFSTIFLREAHAHKLAQRENWRLRPGKEVWCTMVKDAWKTLRKIS